MGAQSAGRDLFSGSLDTHIALWALIDSDKLSSEARALIADGSNSVCVSVISMREIAVKHSLKPNSIPFSADMFESKCKEAGYNIISLEADDILYLPNSDNVHKDPFDRMLICQSVIRNMMLVTHDPLIGRYKESNIVCV